MIRLLGGSWPIWSKFHWMPLSLPPHTPLHSKRTKTHHSSLRLPDYTYAAYPGASSQQTIHKQVKPGLSKCQKSMPCRTVWVIWVKERSSSLIFSALVKVWVHPLMAWPVAFSYSIGCGEPFLPCRKMVG